MFSIFIAFVSLLLPVAVVDTSSPEVVVVQIIELDEDECSHAPDLYFGPACAYHDKCYYNSWTERATCDKWFLEDMLNKCDNLPLQPAAFCGTQAFAYYAVVRMFGEGFYNYSDPSPSGDKCQNWMSEQDKGKRQSLDSHTMIIT